MRIDREFVLLHLIEIDVIGEETDKQQQERKLFHRFCQMVSLNSSEKIKTNKQIDDL